MNNKYYVEIEHNGFNVEAYKQAFVFAVRLAKRDKEVKRIVCYIHTKSNTGYFEPFFDERTIKRLLAENVEIDSFPVPLAIETKTTYSSRKYLSTLKELVLAFGMDLEDLEKLDDYYSVKYIVAIPWLREKTMPWVERWQAKEIMGREGKLYAPTVSCIVKEAMLELSNLINMSTGITHPSDNALAKTYIRALHKYEPSIDAAGVVSYLVTELGWTSAHANDVGRLITILNEGRFYRGGEKTGLQLHYKRWKDKVTKK